MLRTRNPVYLMVCLLLSCLLSGCAQSTTNPHSALKIQLNEAGKSGLRTFEVIGLTESELGTLRAATSDSDCPSFKIYVQASHTHEPANAVAVLGRYLVADFRLAFEPRFPLVPGIRYRAEFDPTSIRQSEPKKIVAEFEIPRPEYPSAVVARVYPSATRLPENLLKFYLHFSAPMSRGAAYEHIHLLNADGKEVEAPFLELGEELWDRDGKRFTLFFDPGRIKRGLKPREEGGPILEEGKRYTLVIDKQWPDEHGSPLKESYRKDFTVDAPKEQRIDPMAWKLKTPAARSTEPLQLGFPEPLDHALLQRLLWVTDAKGQAVPGMVEVGDNETQWLVTPKQSWVAGSYYLWVDVALEDLAGNRLDRPFDADVVEPARKPDSETVRLPFEVKASNSSVSPASQLFQQ